MDTRGVVMSVCEFIGQGHPFEPQINEIRRALGERPASMSPAGTATRTVWQRELKGVPDGNGGWRLDRFYSSLQQWDASHACPFNATTYHYAAKTGGGEWFAFPSEPYLGALADMIAGDDRTDVLQYVVLRRLTFAARDARGAARIGKFKRRSRARHAFEVLGTVADAAERQHLTFRLPKPLTFDHSRNLFYQEVMPGRPANTLVNEHNAPHLLREIGRVQAELHTLDAPVPVSDGRDALAALERECQWIAFFRQADAGRITRVRDLLVSEYARLAPARLTFCHGDFVPSHVLYGPEGWAVVDFDLARRGDPHADLSLFVSSLTLDVPLFSRAWSTGERAGCSLLEQSIAAYLDGYQAHAPVPLDRGRLLWHRMAAEIHLLALMFTKDRFHEGAFDRSLGLIEQLAGELARHKAGAV